LGIGAPLNAVEGKLEAMRPSEKPIRVAIYGSCHAEALQRLLLGVPGAAARLEFAPVKSCIEINADEMADFIARLPGVDLLIYQPVSTDYRGAEFATGRLVEAAGPRTRLLSFAYYHFEIYTPFITAALPTLPAPPFDYMDYLLGALIAHGFSDADVISRLLHLQGVDPYAEGMLAAAFYELRLREARTFDGDRPLDIRIADRVENAFRHQRLGHTLNHPAAPVLQWIALDVLQRLKKEFGVEFDDPRSSDPDPLDDIQFFAAPFVRKAFGLEFSDMSEVVIERRRMSVAAYVEAQRPFYAAIPRRDFMTAMEALAQPQARPWYTPLVQVL
jgi:hypothetical protein